MKRIAVLTATRAEYGLLAPVIKKLMKEKDIEVRVIATGMHLSPEFGNTYQEIEADGVTISKKIEVLMSADTNVSVSKAMGLAMISFAEYFEELKPDALLVLGDRYETLAVCCAAMNAKVPIAHLYGGETTEGAIDEAIRHCITKMSYLHFTSTEEYRNRVIQLGENPERVFCAGAMGVENALKTELMDIGELENSIGVVLDKPFAVVTYHPVTLEQKGVQGEVNALLSAISQNEDMIYIFTKANADMNGRLVNRKIEEYVDTHENAYLFDSLGARRYLSAVNNCAMVIGNSSSGLVEVPSFKKPTINIGDRQKGRLRGCTVIDCVPETESINKAIGKARSKEFLAICKNSENLYGKENTSDIIVEKIKSELLFANVDLKKVFFDLKDNKKGKLCNEE